MDPNLDSTNSLKNSTYGAVHMPTAHMSTGGCEALSGLRFSFVFANLFFQNSRDFRFVSEFCWQLVENCSFQNEINFHCSNWKPALSDALNPNPNSEFRFGFDFYWNNSFAQFPVACATIFSENAISFKN